MEKQTLQTGKNNIKKILKPIIYTILGILVAACLAISICTIYHNNRYVKFWVNGQSMYPTLNKDAKYEDGTLIGEHRDGDVKNNYDVDYGFMDTKEETLNDLKRFDIIVCRYETNSSEVVKRIIALPGETFYLSVGTIGSNDNGNLYVRTSPKAKFTLVEQPISSEIVHGGKYDFVSKYNNSETGYTLKEDEYFVMGDNRYQGNSSDSRQRNEGVKKENIDGKVIGLEAKCKIIYDENSQNYKPTQVHHFFPLRYL